LELLEVRILPVEQFTATANAQGQIVLQFTTITDNAEINGIEVISASGPNAPAITTQPASITVNAGSTATFTVVAGGAGPFTYQWLKNGVAIAGATSASYTTPTLASTDNGEVYSVIVGNASGTVTSTAATLTVNNSGSGYTIYPGFVGVDLNNNTNGAWADNQI
jgi:beta-galactosidase